MAVYHIRPVTLDDVPAFGRYRRLVADEVDNFIGWEPGEYHRTDDEERALLEKHLAQDNALRLLAEADGQIVGHVSCIGGHRISNRQTAGIGIDVHPDWRGMGIGTALMQHMIDWARANPAIHRLELEVFAHNPRALHIYEKLGFVVEGRQRDASFKNGRFVDLLLMSLIVGEPQVKPPAEADVKYPNDVYRLLEVERREAMQILLLDMRPHLGMIEAAADLLLDIAQKKSFDADEETVMRYISIIQTTAGHIIDLSYPENPPD